MLQESLVAIPEPQVQPFLSPTIRATLAGSDEEIDEVRLQKIRTEIETRFRMLRDSLSEKLTKSMKQENTLCADDCRQIRTRYATNAATIRTVFGATKYDPTELQQHEARIKKQEGFVAEIQAELNTRYARAKKSHPAVSPSTHESSSVDAMLKRLEQSYTLTRDKITAYYELGVEQFKQKSAREQAAFDVDTPQKRLEYKQEGLSSTQIEEKMAAREGRYRREQVIDGAFFDGKLTDMARKFHAELKDLEVLYGFERRIVAAVLADDPEAVLETVIAELHAYRDNVLAAIEASYGVNTKARYTAEDVHYDYWTRCWTERIAAGDPAFTWDNFAQAMEERVVEFTAFMDRRPKKLARLFSSTSQRFIKKEAAFRALFGSMKNPVVVPVAAPKPVVHNEKTQKFEEALEKEQGVLAELRNKVITLPMLEDSLAEHDQKLRQEIADREALRDTKIKELREAYDKAIIDNSNDLARALEDAPNQLSSKADGLEVDLCRLGQSTSLTPEDIRWMLRYWNPIKPFTVRNKTLNFRIAECFDDFPGIVVFTQTKSVESRALARLAKSALRGMEFLDAECLGVEDLVTLREFAGFNVYFARLKMSPSRARVLAKFAATSLVVRGNFSDPAILEDLLCFPRTITIRIPHLDSVLLSVIFHASDRMSLGIIGVESIEPDAFTGIEIQGKGPIKIDGSFPIPAAMAVDMEAYKGERQVYVSTSGVIDPTVWTVMSPGSMIRISKSLFIDDEQ